MIFACTIQEINSEQHEKYRVLTDYVKFPCSSPWVQHATPSWNYIQIHSQKWVQHATPTENQSRHYRNFRAKFASSCMRDVNLGRKCDIQYLQMRCKFDLSTCRCDVNSISTGSDPGSFVANIR